MSEDHLSPQEQAEMDKALSGVKVTARQVGKSLEKLAEGPKEVVVEEKISDAELKRRFLAEQKRKREEAKRNQT